MRRWLAVVALLLLPLAELGVFFYVAERVGYGTAIGAQIVAAIIGVALIRLQGFRALVDLPQALLAGGGFAFKRWMRRQLGYIAAGVLFFVPGFLTDAAAILIILLQLFVPAARPSARTNPHPEGADAAAGSIDPRSPPSARPPRGRILEGEYRREKPPRA